MEITKKQLIEITKAGFPEYVWDKIKDNPMDILHISGVYYLFNTDTGYTGVIPKHFYVAFSFDKDKKFVQFDTKYRKFNQYAAIKKMEELRLIGVADISEFCQPVDTKKATINALENLLEHIKTDTEFEGYSFEMRLEQEKDFLSGKVYKIREFVVSRIE